MNYKDLNIFENVFVLKCRDINESNIAEYEQAVLKYKNANLSYAFAKYAKGANIEAHEQIVIESKDSYLCYIFARDVKGAYIEPLEQVIIENKDVTHSCYFALGIIGANIKALTEVVIESKECAICCSLASELSHLLELGLISDEDDNIKALEQVIIESGNSNWCYRFATETAGADIKALKKVLIVNKDFKLCNELDKFIKNRDKIEKLKRHK